MLHSFYRIAGVAVSPLVALGLLASARGRVRYRERLGMWGSIPGSPWWFHGASVGEVQGLLPVLKAFRDQCSDQQLLLTGTSPTGLERGAPYVDQTRLLPIDALPFVRHALKSCSPKGLVVSETELWPELLAQVIAAGIPLSIINGRVSDYTLVWYQRLRSIFSPLLEQCAHICVPDQVQHDRFIELGARSERVYITGHTKYDAEPRFPGDLQRQEIRSQLFTGLQPGSRLVVLGSIRPEEERVWFPALQTIWDKGGDVKVVVAPRHVERVGYFSKKLSDMRIAFDLRSSLGSNVPSSARVLLLDVMGELERSYAAADLAFVGATLVDIGGHNPLEPAMYGVPVCVGPYSSVIRTIVQQMRSRSGILEVSNQSDIEGLLEKLLLPHNALRDVGAAGQFVWQHHRGSSRRVLERIVGR